MNQLPTLSGSADSKPAIGNSAAANEKGNAAADNQPFGEMLARQLGGKSAATDKQDSLKNNAITAMAGLKSSLKEILDSGGDTGLAANDAEAPPTDPGLLASLSLPLVLNNWPIQPASGTETDAQLSRTDHPHVQTEDEKTNLSGKNDSQKSVRKERADHALPSTATAPAAAISADSSRVATAQMTENSPVATATVSPQLAAATALPLSGNHPVNPPLQTSIPTPITHRQWADDFGQKVTWLATQNQQRAELHLNPAHLGPLDVTLKLNGDQATVQFSSPHAAVREAIEQSFPKLREMFADNGIMLGGATVSDQSQREQYSESGRPSTAGPDIRHAETVGTAGSLHSPRIAQHDGMVDTFA